jgi:hypothetical protein
MYPNPSQIRSNVVKICLNDKQAAELEQAAKVFGEQKQVFVRKMYLLGLTQVLASIQEEQDHAKSA